MSILNSPFLNVRTEQRRHCDVSGQVIVKDLHKNNLKTLFCQRITLDHFCFKLTISKPCTLKTFYL